MKNGDQWPDGRHFGKGKPQFFASESIEGKGVNLELSQPADPAGIAADKPGFPSFLSISILLVGSHSMILGLFIYFFTNFFYEVFYSAQPENIFFVKQSGIFLFCLGAFYLLPCINFQKYYSTVLLTVFTKIVAVLFLVFNAQLSLSPTAIYLAAAGDASMAILLLIALAVHKRHNRGEK